MFLINTEMTLDKMKPKTSKGPPPAVEFRKRQLMHNRSLIVSVSIKNALEEHDLAATFIQYLLLFLYNPEF